MKKKYFWLVFVITLTTLVGCEKQPTAGKTNFTSQTTTIQEKESSTPELVGEPSEKIIPKINGKNIVNFSDYEKLDKDEKNSVLFNYIVTALSGVYQGEENVIRTLNDQGYTLDSDFDAIFVNLRADNPQADLNDILIKLVGKFI